ncbi:hypothetical protein [Caldilinea sp.]|uniref:hypothetical protein n=1 Tax=Caldilinea sp. TaxID=2293560 RepID=UPI002626B496|nr:hypothetical protein [Caldilinea sp.]
MKVSTIRLLAIPLSVGCLIMASIGIAIAVSGSWSKNGVSMSGNHFTNWVQPIGREMWSSSSAQTPRGVIASIFADARLQDRCRNPDGTWQSWNMYGYGNSSASWAYSSGTAYATGNYQNCQYGHQYLNQSLHSFSDSAFGINEAYWLLSS